MDNTYIIYTTDNGYHIGQQRLDPGKTCAFEEDINIPFFIRGPNIPINATSDVPTSHTDIAPTIFRLAQMDLRSDFDGAPMPLFPDHAPQDPQKERSEHVSIEFWGASVSEGEKSATRHYGNNTYKSLRLISPENGYDLSYMVWCTNEHELYDMKTDEYQMNNLYNTSNTLSGLNGYSVDKVTQRLDALVLVLKTCSGASCRKPWEEIHKDGKVESLKDAMDVQYDGYYQQLPNTSFTNCALGYLEEFEGAQWADAMADGEHLDPRGGTWSDWV